MPATSMPGTFGRRSGAIAPLLTMTRRKAKAKRFTNVMRRILSRCAARDLFVTQGPGGFNSGRAPSGAVAGSGRGQQECRHRKDHGTRIVGRHLEQERLHEL